MLKGEKVTLRPLQMSDIDLLMNWDLDVDMNILGGWVEVRSVPWRHDKHESRIKEPREGLISFMIDVDSTPVGRIDLGMDERSERRGEIGFLIDRRYWRKGYGKDAVITFLQYLFQIRNLHKVSGMSYEFNAASIRLFESVGFTREGVLRKHEWTTGAYRDMVVFGMLEEEFARLYPGRRYTIPVE